MFNGPSFPYTFQNGRYGGGGAAASGTITATFVFHPTGAEAAPDFVYVEEKCEAQGTSGTPYPVPTVNNGLETKVVTTSFTPPGSNYTQTQSYANGNKLQYVYVGGAYTFQITAAPSATGQLSCSVWYSAAVVPKGFTIYSDRDMSYHKGTTGPVSNTTNVATPRYADTWIDPDIRYWIPGPVPGQPALPIGDFFIDVLFSRELLGAWTNPKHYWNTDPQIFVDDLLHEYESVTSRYEFTEEQVGQMGENGPVTKEIKLTIEDNGGSGLSSNAVYRLRIHNKYENWQLEATLPSIYEPVGGFEVALPGYALGGGGIQCTWTEAGPYWSAMLSAFTAIITVTDPFIKNPFYKAGFKALNIGAESLGPKPNNGVAPWAWNTPGSEIEGGNWSVDQSYYRMEPMLEIGYDVFRQVADQYGQNGYIGQVRDVKRKQNGSYRWTGNFIRNDGGENGGQL